MTAQTAGVRTTMTRTGHLTAAVATVAVAIAVVALLANSGHMMEWDAHGVRVTEQEFGEQWPLTVSAGTLRCEWGDEITIHRQGTTYTLTGTAVNAAYAGIQPIWADDHEGTGKKSLGPLVNRGRELCR